MAGTVRIGRASNIPVVSRPTLPRPAATAPGRLPGPHQHRALDHRSGGGTSGQGEPAALPRELGARDGAPAGAGHDERDQDPEAGPARQHQHDQEKEPGRPNVAQLRPLAQERDHAGSDYVEADRRHCEADRAATPAT